ncbi:DUF4147 domain-containing protein [Ensifer canadensis]
MLGSARLLEAASDMCAYDLVIALVSGGGSAMDALALGRSGLSDSL